MLRDFLTGLCLVVASTGAFAADNVLTGKTLIDGDRVTVGDLFTNTGRHAGYVLAPAPKVGEKLVLAKADLDRVVQAFHLNWQAATDDVTVSLQRNAVAVDAEKIADALAKSDLKDKISTDATFQIESMSEPLVFKGLDRPSLKVLKTAFDPVTEKFAATIQIVRDDEILKEFNVKGTATPMVKLPVLTHTGMPNALITKDDIAEISMPKRDVRPNAFLSKDELIGMTPKRTLAAGQIISHNDVTPPILVKRNELITVLYQSGPVRLSTKARAMDNGAKGDTITLQNPTSKKPFQATITGPQQAEVSVDAING